MKITTEGEKEAYQNTFPTPGSADIPSSSQTSPQQGPAAKDPVAGKNVEMNGIMYSSNVRSF